MYVQEKEPLRERSDTFIKIEEFAKDFGKSKSFALFFIFVSISLAVTNIGTSVAANILTRKVTVQGPALTTTDGVQVSTLSTLQYGIPAECSTLESIQQSSSISVDFSPLDSTNVFTARIASVLSIPVPQSTCGYYLLVRTIDPLYDVVVADNVTSIIGKEKGNNLMKMSLPVNQNTRVYMTTFESTTKSSFASTSSLPSSSKSAAPQDVVIQDEARLTAIGIWTASMFITGQLDCGQSVAMAAIPAIVSTRAGQCPITDAQLNAIGNLFASGSTLLNAAKQKLIDNPSCAATVTDALTDMQNALSSECDSQLLTILHVASMSNMTVSNESIERAATVRTIVLNTTEMQTRRHLLVTFKAGGKPLCDYCQCIKKSKTSCSVSITCLIGTAIDNLWQGWIDQANAVGYQW